ncbi:hypothetical protein HZY83_04560 [Gemella sp. GH3]|uniref:hypothetical protein n=1 Tax=unclassified Gemella TaxID=2624949 RepID=UPI0015D050E7|nr:MULTISPECIES: hypothetical protein [unclassified Gemella]MBF0713953.1 hypothetical protein [Gemella sp. GH3.1]NYS50905.1 hypothetical protein [Gemella sp. GH3]
MSEYVDKASGIVDFIKGLNTKIEKEEYIYNIVREIQEKEDIELLLTLSEMLIIDDDYSSTKYAADLRMRLLYQLIDNTANKIDSTEDEEEKDDLYYNLYNYMWYFKWIIPEIPNSLAVSKEMIDSANDMMYFYYTNLNISLAMYYKSMMLQNIIMGQIEKAKENYKLWQESDSDAMNDCEACEVTEQVNYACFVGEYEEALFLAEPILAGKLSCAEVPHITYAPVLKSLVALGEYEKAKKLFPEAVEHVERDLDLVYAMIPDFIEVAVKLNDIEYAKQLAEKYKEEIFDTTEHMPQLRYFIATSPFDEESYECALELATLIDERNENNYYKEYLAKYTRKEPRKKITFK